MLFTAAVHKFRFAAQQGTPQALPLVLTDVVQRVGHMARLAHHAGAAGHPYKKGKDYTD